MGWRGHPTQSKWELLLCEGSIHVGLLFGGPHIYFRAKKKWSSECSNSLSGISNGLMYIFHYRRNLPWPKKYLTKSYAYIGYEQDFFLSLFSKQEEQQFTMY